MASSNLLKPVHLFTLGAYGRAIARYLTLFRQDIVEFHVEGDILPLPEVWPDSRAIIVAAWRPVPTLCEFVDEISHAWKRPFIPVIQDGAELRIGPVIIPGRGTCWRCWVKRHRQRSEWPEASFAVLQHYANHPESGPGGFLDSMALAAAARLHALVDGLESGPGIAGTLWQINVLSREVTTCKVIGVHACKHCGVSCDAATRTVAAAQQELKNLWQQPERRSEA